MEPLLLLAPGAGAPSDSPWMGGWARRLAALGRDHSLEVGARALRAAGRTQERVDAEALAAVQAFLADVLR